MLGAHGRCVQRNRTFSHLDQPPTARLSPDGAPVGPSRTTEPAGPWDDGTGTAVEGWVRSLPKAEVHVHLEGGFDGPTIAALAEAAGEPLPRPVDRLFEFDDLAQFLELLDWTCGLVRTAEQVEQAAYSFAAREAGSGVPYADVIVNPTHWGAWSDRLEEFVTALDRGFTRAEAAGLTPCGLCVSLLRQQSAREAEAVVARLIDLGSERVVALSVDGNEAAAGRTADRFAGAFARAARAGLRRTVHAGESSGPEGIRDALDVLGADRIDHGVRAVEDPALVAVLADRGVPLGVCPTSNVKLGLYPSYHDHPIERLRRAGVAVSVNTDDPCLLATSVEAEYAAAGLAYGWVEADYLAVAETSLRAAFCSEARRAELLDRLTQTKGTFPC